MTIGDILFYVADVSGRQDLKEKIKRNEVDFEDEEVERILSCYNLLVCELCEEIEPLIFSEDLQSQDGKFYYKDFQFKPTKILSVFENGKKIKFENLFTHLKVDAKEITVTYERAPKKPTELLEESEYSDVFSLRVLGSGVLAEYLLTIGLFDEAIVWRSRFEDAIKKYTLKKKRKIIKQRAWQ